MRIILSPAKKMNVDTDKLECQGLPVFMEQTQEILDWLRVQTHEDLQKLWGCNDKIAEQNFWRMKGSLFSTWHLQFLRIALLIMFRSICGYCQVFMVY